MNDKKKKLNQVHKLKSQYSDKIKYSSAKDM